MPFFRKLLAGGATELPITDTRMTRFWITLPEGVDFVIKSFERMRGGELFVPKIPSIRMTDLAQSLAPGLPHKLVGIRPGEKVHEIMCPLDDAHQTLEFKRHYVIKPTIQFSDNDLYTEDALGERGKPVSEDFEYHSQTNPHFLSGEELRHLNEQID
jgi:UDP-N-acetylglucosamine 4,6-dehydratase